ncbi:MAG: GNAT family N-acetyltransferase, partial [Chloroflexota bacterium]|nr:GNAT family N-acetyltransferase [Chloroflexota bacterium]
MRRREPVVVDAGAVRIRLAGPDDSAVISHLWEFSVRPGTPSKPGVCFVARDERAGEILGAAEYVRTFPPEDGIWAVVVAPHARRQGVGTRLLRALAEAALRDGIRNLGAFVDYDDVATWRLLSAVGIPVRVYQLGDTAYVEMDLV